KVNRNGVWSAETAFTNDSSAQNTDPSAYQMRNGTTWLVWSHYDANGQRLFYKTLNPTTLVWSSQIQFTSTTNPDMHPAITQDQNNTIWIAWSREISCGGTCFQWDVFYKYTINYGVTWSAETNFTNDAACTINCADDMMSSDAQLKDGRIYLFWASTRDPQSYWDIYYASTVPQPFHNVAITGFTYGPTYHIRLGALVTINVTVADTGTFPESFFLFITATNTSYTPATTNIAVQYLSLGAGQSMKIQIAWNGSPAIPGEYVLGAHIPPVNNDIVTGDNTISSGTLRLYPQGDVNWDGAVNIQDLAIIAAHYNTTLGQPGYLPDADLDGNGIINIVDLATCAFYFGTVG
ncbi:MAG TPA: dockerin type I domain-containing protein, partial [Candidatus Bathyarchaeia archaeon]|nr:dockerin type I domain-containing protein [Candidatus Bathyarchaeia archaeon]